MGYILSFIFLKPSSRLIWFRILSEQSPVERTHFETLKWAIVYETSNSARHTNRNNLLNEALTVINRITPLRFKDLRQITEKIWISVGLSSILILHCTIIRKHTSVSSQEDSQNKPRISSPQRNEEIRRTRGSQTPGWCGDDELLWKMTMNEMDTTFLLARSDLI